MVSLFTGNKFDVNSDIPDLSGKVYLVTGGSAGIGFGIVAHILQHKPAKILLLSMKEDHAQEAIDKLADYGDATKVEWKQCNLENFKMVDEVTQEIKKKEKRLDVIVANAGLGVGVYGETVDGIESKFQVNVLSHMHMIFQLLPLLRSTAETYHTDVRIVTQSSDLHRAAPSDVKFASLAEINTDIGATYLYNRSKLALVLFIRALERRRTDPALYLLATHPGAVATDQQKQAEDAYGVMGVIASRAMRPLMKDPTDQGCIPALFAATSKEVVTDDLRGSYIVPDKKPTDPSSQAMDDTLGEQLWKLSSDLLKQKLGVDYSGLNVKV